MIRKAAEEWNICAEKMSNLGYADDTTPLSSIELTWDALFWKLFENISKKVVKNLESRIF